MDENRKAGLVLGGCLLFGLTFLLFVLTPTTNFYWGLLGGVVLGIATSLYLYETWDPYLLAPKNSNTQKASWKIWWVVPIGILAANILMDLFPEPIRELLIGSTIAWVIVAVGYMMIQAWRYR